MPGCNEITARIADFRPTVDAVLPGLADRCHPAVLDSADTGTGRGRFTILAFGPSEVASWSAGGPDPFEEMRGRVSRVSATAGFTAPVTASDAPLPFVGGWIGYFAYEAGRWIEKLPQTARPDVGIPIARFARYETAAIHDAQTGRWTIVAADLRRGPSLPAPQRRIEDWLDILREAERRPAPPPSPPPRLAPATDNMSHDDYLAMVQRAVDYIAAGDVFQVNLARRRTFGQQEPIIETYRRLRQTNPGAYAALLGWNPSGLDNTPPEAGILSASPELFLSLRNGDVVTRPIKGTRPRCGDPVVDAAYQAELCLSEKDRAELAMIVDLERNDLGRVCEFGSVRVTNCGEPPSAPYQLEAHPTVHHLVATVTGRLRAEHDAVDLLRACFPGGSITGAPKVRAMEIIDELEPTERSVYTGSIGYFGFDGSMTFNIAIRTMIAHAGRIHIYAGGGIVADSVPEFEYQETCDKALGLCRALGAESELAPDPRLSTGVAGNRTVRPKGG